LIRRSVENIDNLGRELTPESEIMAHRLQIIKQQKNKEVEKTKQNLDTEKEKLIILEKLRLAFPNNTDEQNLKIYELTVEPKRYQTPHEE